MNYLLDTHTFLWSFADSGALSKRAIDVIRDSENVIFVSAVTFWEIAIKVRLNKLYLGGLEPRQLTELARQMEFTLIDLTTEEAATYGLLEETTHKDPFDRMLVWQSIQRKIPIISKDKKFTLFSKYGLQTFW